MADGAEHRFVEIPFQSVWAKKLDRQPRRADEWPENPAELAAEKQIACQPGEKGFARDLFAPTKRFQ